MFQIYLAFQWIVTIFMQKGHYVPFHIQKDELHINDSEDVFH